MADSFTETVVLPIASPDDAETTCAAVLPRLESADHVVVVHVIEKAGGGIDKASVEQREQRAEELFNTVTERFDDAGVPVETRLLFGTDVTETILDAAADVDATAIMITPRSANRWIRLLSGDVALSLVTDTDRPLIVVPEAEEDRGS